MNTIKYRELLHPFVQAIAPGEERGPVFILARVEAGDENKSLHVPIVSNPISYRHPTKILQPPLSLSAHQTSAAPRQRVHSQRLKS